MKTEGISEYGVEELYINRTERQRDGRDRCEAGCIGFYGGERRHHKDCLHYPDSLTKYFEDKIRRLTASVEAADALADRAESLLKYLNSIDDGDKGVFQTLKTYRATREQTEEKS